MPAQVTRELLARASRVIALKEAEHRVLVLERYPDFAHRVEYWHVDDVDCCPAEAALDAIDTRVEELLTSPRR
jgi:protein-tyrosine phosphatase